MPAVLQKDSVILIVGAGTWGTSIAYQLAQRGYTQITVLDSHGFPSAVAAASEEPLPDQDDSSYAWAVIENIATKIWKGDPIYSQHYHNAGFIYAAVGDDAYAKVQDSCRKRPDLYTPLTDAAAFKFTSPAGVLTGGFEGWRGYLRKRTAGWVEARDTILDVHAEAVRMGVKFICDPKRGKVNQLLFTSGTDVVGVLTDDGEKHLAQATIVSAGASSTSILDFENQLRPTAWTLAHIALTEVEAKSGAYNELPVLYGVDRGFFISPPRSEFVAGTPELKICNEHPGYINLLPHPITDEATPVAVQRDAIPLMAANDMRSFLEATAPHLANRPLLRPRLCWDADTPDRLFLLSQHPRYPSLFVATGGSGNGFMCSPAVGVLMSDLLENQIDNRLRKILGWRPETAVGRDWFDTQERFGGCGKVVDLQTLKNDEWTRTV